MFGGFRVSVSVCVGGFSPLEALQLVKPVDHSEGWSGSLMVEVAV